MAVQRFANIKPLAGVNTLLWDVTKQALVSVVAVNIGGTTKISAYVEPSEPEYPDDIYYINDVPLKNRDTFETFKLAVNIGDKIYVSSESGDVSFFTNGIYDKNGTTDVHVGVQAPEYPVVGTIWIDESDPLEHRVKYFDGSSFVDVGIAGPENVLSIGTVESADFGDPASATITGTSPEQVLNLVLPVGDQGPANSLTVGTVVSADFGDDPEVTITGDSPDQTINFVLPVGDAGPSNTLTLGTVTTGETGSDAIVEITGTSPNQTINFTIPEGPVGVSNTLTVGTVISVGPEGDPAVIITGDSPNQTIDFILQQGIQGPPGDLGTATLTDLQDVTITGTPTEGSLLVYNETTEQWENRESSGNIPDLNMVIMGAY